MDAERIAVARSCLADAYEGCRSFPEIIDELLNAGFEGYLVDYRRRSQTYYLPDGDSVVFDMPEPPAAIAATFDCDAVKALIHWAQAGDPDYSYPAFCERVGAAGCAGYLVSFPGRRVVYYGRTGETHVEPFPQ